MPDVKTLYDEDFVAWSEQQAEALRSAARSGSNQKLDWENLAEEIESLGNSQKAALHSQIRRIVQHLVKLGHSPAMDPRGGWRESVRDARAEIDDLLMTSPSLRPTLGEIIAAETKKGVRLAIANPEDRGELGDLQRNKLRNKNYLELLTYTEAEILGDWFPPEPKA